MTADQLNWTRILDPRERYRIVYIDSDNLRSQRTVDLLKIGDRNGTPYLGVMYEGGWKPRSFHAAAAVWICESRRSSIRRWQVAIGK